MRSRSEGPEADGDGVTGGADGEGLGGRDGLGTGELDRIAAAQAARNEASAAATTTRKRRRDSIGADGIPDDVGYPGDEG